MNTKFWTAFASIEQLDSPFIQRLYNYFGDVETAWNTTLSLPLYLARLEPTKATVLSKLQSNKSPL